jgi:hypothetical protein
VDFLEKFLQSILPLALIVAIWALLALPWSSPM